MSTHADDLARLSRAFADRSAGDQQACPNPETVFEAATGSLGHDETLALVDHLTGCVECSQAWQLASALADENMTVDRNSSTWARPFAIAAMVTIVAVGAVFVVVPPQDPTPVYRDAPPSTMIALAEPGSLSRGTFLLRWSGDERATGYTLRVSDEMLTRLFVIRDLKVSEYLVPEASLESVASGSMVYWQVEMQLPNGQIKQSVTSRVTLR